MDGKNQGNNGETGQNVQGLTRYEEKNFVDTSKSVWNYSLLDDEDIRNFQQGTHYRLYQKFGSHSIQVNNVWGMYFCVWAPNATSISVVGNFNDWKEGTSLTYGPLGQ